MLIRDAGSDDAAAIAAIYGHHVLQGVATFDTTPPDAQEWAGKIATLRQLALPVLVGTDGGQTIGFAYLSPWRPRPAYRQTVEDAIYLDPAQTGRGHGRWLLAELLRRAGQAEVRQVIAVIADTGDDASAALHRAAGFAEAGRLRAVGYKHGRWVDTVLMQRALPAAADQLDAPPIIST